jgi:hypothetical protein
MKLGRRATLWVISLGALTGACSSSNSTPTITVAAACDDVAQARCYEASICTLADGQTGTGFNILDNYGSTGTCVARQTTNCTNALNAPMNGNSATQVEMCAGELGGFSCQDFLDNSPPAACMATGPGANGVACTFNGQCTSGYCGGKKTSVCGTCSDEPAVGTDCTDTACAPGQRCVASTKLCQIPGITNSTCDTGHPCEHGLSCVGQNTQTMTPGTCESAGTRVGVACGGSMPGCDPTRGLYCGGPNGSKTCMQVIYPGYNGSVSDGGAMARDGAAPDGGAAPTPKGTACGQLADGTRVGCVAGDCYTATGLATGTDQGTCVPFADDNAPCDTTLGPGCMFPARCVVAGSGDAATTGTCTIPTSTACP